MDAWFFPISASTYENLKDENIMLLNSETFFHKVPFIYHMERKMNRIREGSPNTLKGFVVKKTDHISTSDFAYVLGTIMKLTGTVNFQ